jgi:hypothetical protein
MSFQTPFIVDNLFTDDEIYEWLTFIQKIEKKDIRPFTNSQFKNGKVWHPEWSQLMFNRLAPHIPEQYRHSVAPYIMFSHIRSGEHFGIHTDTGCVYDIEKKEISKFTVLIYLNDTYEGGTTQFYTDDFIPTEEIIPKRGRTLVFDIDLFHKGNEVLSGDKYWVGTELVSKII